MAQIKSSLLLLLLISSSTLALAAYNVVDFGAKPDGRTDSAKAFLAAWAKACAARIPVSMTVPQGRFMVSHALFQGPCNNAAIRVIIQGTLVAPSGYSQSKDWITFKYVKGVSVYGGTLDAQGQKLWNCKMAGRSCPAGATVGHVLHVSNSHRVMIHSYHIGKSNSSYPSRLYNNK